MEKGSNDPEGLDHLHHAASRCIGELSPINEQIHFCFAFFGHFPKVPRLRIVFRVFSDRHEIDGYPPEEMLGDGLQGGEARPQ